MYLFECYLLPLRQPVCLLDVLLRYLIPLSELFLLFKLDHLAQVCFLVREVKKWPHEELSAVHFHLLLDHSVVLCWVNLAVLVCEEG